MANIANLLKLEISRVARKEIKAQIATLQQAVRTYRSDIASLKRRAYSLEQAVKVLGKGHSGRTQQVPAGADEGATEQTRGSDRRFSAKGFASIRRRLGVSARELGMLVGTTAQSIYNWEVGKAKPRSRYLAVIAALRIAGKKQVRAHLEAMGKR